MKTWCKHIKFKVQRWFDSGEPAFGFGRFILKHKRIYIELPDEYKFCPICGAKRPPKK